MTTRELALGDRGTEPPLVIVKLGGSVITRKRETERPRPKVIARLAREIASVHGVRAVILHGAGSFGHPGAKRFGLSTAPPAGEPTGQRARGAAIVEAEVRRLHLLVLRALVAAGAAPASIPIATHARNRGGELVHFDPSPFDRALAAGRLPVSFGDVVPDERWGSSILSADTIALELARTLRPDRVVFVSDVPGVLEGSPRERRRVVPELTEATLASLAPGSGATDVTGGIRAKVRAMIAISRTGADAALISGLSDGALSRALSGETVHGSWAHRRAG